MVRRWLTILALLPLAAAAAKAAPVASPTTVPTPSPAGPPSAAPTAAPPASRHEVVVRVRLNDQAITPVTARFISQTLRLGADLDARYVIIELDTPGGLVDSTREIVRDILASPTEVVVYVAPAGGRAASAGLFLTLAAHVAAMAPGTNIGAAHPVHIGELPTGTKPDGGAAQRDIMGEKSLNDTLAWARSLAELRGRNAEVAAAAVADSRSLTATEALESGLIDFVAADLPSLLAQLGVPDAEVHTVELTIGQRILAMLASPNLAFILLILGVYALAFEFYTGGFGIAGVVGAICIILASVGLAILPLNYAGLALIGVGLGFFVAEAFIVSFGLLTVGGVLCTILGGLLLVDSPTGFARVSFSVVLPAALASAAIMVFLVGNAVKARRGRVQTGNQALATETAIAQEDFHRIAGEKDGDDTHGHDGDKMPDVGARYGGTVLVHGEFWNARSDAPVSARDQLRIVNRTGLTLDVKPRGASHGATSEPPPSTNRGTPP